MKKMKGVAAAAATVMEYSPYAVYEDQRTRFKHQSLMQDFEDLHKETEAMRKKLQKMKEQRLTLLAEVQFLKRRHKFLLQNQSSNTPAEGNLVPSPNMMIRSKSKMKDKKTTGKKHTLRCLDLNQKGKIYSENETTFTHPSLMFDLNEKQQKNFSGKEEVTLRSSLPILDLIQKERLYRGKEATARSMTPIFDLNQISREEEELQANDNPVGIEEFKKGSIRIGSDEQHNDIKILAYRNSRNGPNRVGKRRISWQDQVALRV
ncbi:uncharacterized protein LOC111302887 [Durio zibethinus]|uniref:Uncharacterized protein LOC111302887 n=1 Tax=Durio zibethinus TaxID=66656 RepID=A0A6P5ZPP6_DURZI|nr:uncharacterized protein LOC111302887 [Durio zibethinus]